MRKTALCAVLSATIVAFIATFANAGSALWDLNPGSGDWNTASNWTPMTVPNGSADTATFAASNTTSVSISANTEVDGITFTPAAPTYDILVDSNLMLSGSGVTGGSFGFHTFRTSSNGTITFRNSSTANANVSLVNNGVVSFRDNSNAGNTGAFSDGGIDFFDNSSAASLHIDNEGGVSFFNNSTAANASIFNEIGAGVLFSGASSAGNATINGVDSTRVVFEENASAENANIGLAGGLISFSGSSKGGTAAIFLGVIAFSGELDISEHDASGVTIGSLAGRVGDETPFVSLGANKLTVGSNNLSTTFPGLIVGSGGSLAKIGTGTLELTGASTYTGGTTVSAGTLLINNTTGSGTGTGAVQVTGGTLSGNGTIAGAVTVGTGTGAGAAISPGNSVGTLTIQSALTLYSDATYQFELNSATALADKIVANGVTINGAEFSFTDLGDGKLAPGTTFIVIDNTSSFAITGTFGNLLDHSDFTDNGNTYVVSYRGGTGNDLTLTVEPGTEPVPDQGSTFLLLTLSLLGLVTYRWRATYKQTLRSCA